MKEMSQEETEVYNHAIKEWFNNPELSTINMDVFVKGAIFGAKWQRDQSQSDRTEAEAKELIKQYTANLNRVEVVDYNKGGRAYTNYSVRGVQLSFQDKGETLKVFVK